MSGFIGDLIGGFFRLIGELLFRTWIGPVIAIVIIGKIIHWNVKECPFLEKDKEIAKLFGWTVEETTADRKRWGGVQDTFYNSYHFHMRAFYDKEMRLLEEDKEIANLSGRHISEITAERKNSGDVFQYYHEMKMKHDKEYSDFQYSDFQEILKELERDKIKIQKNRRK